MTTHSAPRRHALRRIVHRVLSCLLLAGAQLAPAATDPVQPPMILAGPPSFRPFCWVQDGMLRGAGVDLAEIVLRDMGLASGRAADPDANWLRVQRQAAAGEVDLIVSVYDIPARREYLAFARPAFAFDKTVAWQLQSSTRGIDHWTDLQDRRGLALTGDSYGEDFDAFARTSLSLTRISTPQQAVQMLLLNRADYFIYGYWSGSALARKMKLDTQLKPSDAPLVTNPVLMGIALKGRLAPLRAEFERALARRVADGTAERLVQQYVE
jgi:polar amino acid transport system substrate-binding protein